MVTYMSPLLYSPKSKLHCAASVRSLKASGTVSENPALPLHDALPALNGAGEAARQPTPTSDLQDPSEISHLFLRHRDPQLPRG